MQFTVALTGLGQAISDSLGSLTPIFLIPAGLVIAAGALGWGLSMLKSWRGKRA